MINDVVEINNSSYVDERGHFLRIFDQRKIEISKNNICQVNLSTNPKAFTLRGMHYQIKKRTEHKVIKLEKGEIFLAIVDLRKESDSYLQSYQRVLSSSNPISLFIPAGCATGWLSLKDDTQIIYLMFDYFENCEYGGARYDDPKLNINWPEEPKIISTKDLSWSKLE